MGDQPDRGVKNGAYVAHHWVQLLLFVMNLTSFLRKLLIDGICLTQCYKMVTLSFLGQNSGSCRLLIVHVEELGDLTN